ncbi:SipW-dependent-type signal peptide-containing protein [Renibacterium salmoninarum]|nr:SipW-dependent-type signal peptide-containing protein [Renibacterium salmoninarum]
MSRHSQKPNLWRRFGSVRARALLALGMVFGLGAVGTLAAWQDTSAVTSGSFVAGTVDLTLRQGSASSDGAVGLNQPYAFTDFAGTNLAPGGVAVFKQLTVRNSGSLNFNYSIAVTGSGTLATDATGLNIGIYASATCTATTTAGQLYSGKIGGAATAVRALAAAGADLLCVRAWLDTAAVTGLQNQTGVIVFNFSAIQS